jgi:biopolymer transport protein ExbD
MRIHYEDDEGETAINLTPMIDVVFQLVIFFMLATEFTVKEKSLDVDLPAAASGREAITLPEEIVIDVHADGRIVLGGTVLDEPSLASSLQLAAQRDPATPVTIRGDQAVHHRFIVAVMDACGVAGLTNLQIGTLEKGA